MCLRVRAWNITITFTQIFDVKDLTYCHVLFVFSVVLASSTKDKIIADLDVFLTKESCDFYTSHGIPYKRSYLFYGVPGAGKTSLLTALAGKYGRNLCILQPTDPRRNSQTSAL